MVVGKANCGIKWQSQKNITLQLIYCIAMSTSHNSEWCTSQSSYSLSRFSLGSDQNKII